MTWLAAVGSLAGSMGSSGGGKGGSETRQRVQVAQTQEVNQTVNPAGGSDGLSPLIVLAGVVAVLFFLKR